MRALLPLWHLAQRLYYDWALREIHPLHPDVPEIILARAKLPAWRERGVVRWWLVCSLAAATWLAVVTIAPQPIGHVSATEIRAAVTASRADDLGLCQQMHGPEAVAVQLPDGSHRCADKHGRRLHSSVITTDNRKESSPWNGLTSY